MANTEWIEIFRTYSPDELAAHVTKLKGEISVYAAQSVGNKSYQKSLDELRSQLSSAVRVQGERSAGKQSFYGITDFSRVR